MSGALFSTSVVSRCRLVRYGRWCGRSHVPRWISAARLEMDYDSYERGVLLFESTYRLSIAYRACSGVKFSP